MTVMTGQKGVRAGHPDLRKAQRNFKPGYWLKSSGSNHFIVMGPDDEPVRRNDGSGRHLGLPSSPRSSSISYHLRRLRDHGVLEERETSDAKIENKTVAHPDLTRMGVHDAHASVNNEDTKQLIQDLASVGVHKPRTLIEYRELSDIMKYVTGEQWETATMRLFNGMTLNRQELEAHTTLLGYLEGEEDPIRARFGLLRKARNLPPQQEEEVVEEEQPLQQQQEEEEHMSTTEQENLIPIMSATGSTEQIVGEFISNLRDKVSEMLDEMNKIEDLIKTLEEQYPSIKVEADEDSGGSERSRSNGGSTTESRTVRVQPEPGNPVASRSGQRGKSSQGSGSRFDPEEVMRLVNQGGEWTVKELAEATGKADPTIHRALSGLIEEGKVVLVTPAQMGHGGRKPGTYGSAEFFSK